MAESFTIAQQFNGPPDSGNGGYVCGKLAGFVGGPAIVTLRAPPPLETPIQITRTNNGVSAHHGDALIAEAAPASISWVAPAAPNALDVDAAAKRFRGFHNHFFTGCFTCGTARGIDDGLRIFTGPVAQRDMVATAWIPSAAWADARGAIAPEFIWAALDCPTFWAHEHINRALLARLALDISEAPRVGEALIIAAWPLSSEGRKYNSGAALYRASGEVLARAEALWIELKPT
ncbi:hypothetical protein U91I_01225 [alpha proteobacterium U9-1i]|nr:hypothetical protein U91I_01225 [alpha proteobacterium U9-1i]